MLCVPSIRRSLASIGLTLCLTLPLAASFDSHLDDLELYGTWAKQISVNVLPYRDTVMEYPPLATLVIVLPGLVSTSRVGFATAFVVLMAIVDALGKSVMAQSLPCAARKTFWYVATALSLVANYIFLRRFDPVAGALSGVALALSTKRPKSMWPFVYLGLGAAIKLYPCIFAPAMAAFVWHKHRDVWRLIGQLTTMALSALMPGAIAFVWAGPPSLRWMTYHHERGLHVASSLMAWAIAWRGGPGVHFEPRFAYGCTQVVGTWGDQLAQLSPRLGLVALAATCVAMGPRLRTADGLWRMATALVCALLLTAKVFSPQYIVWLVGPGAMACAGSRRLSPYLIAPLCLATLATAQLFPGETRLLTGYRPSQWWLIVRTLSLMALWGHLIWRQAAPREGGTTQRVIDNDLGKRQIPLSTR